MNKNPYMSKNELINWLKLAVLVGELDSMIENTKDSIWRKAMKTARTLLSKIVEERLSFVQGCNLRKNTLNITLNKKVRMI